ncbi:MAG TPA: hypothetical protein VFQ53_32705 [Kofleriaceae bacterium]|nr:hypothetical protein [Kofleriaceae bacterium]
MLAGTALAIGTWLLLQLFGTGVALSVLDADDVDQMRGVGIGTTAWSVLAPLVAMFVGGLLAGWLAGFRDRKVAGLHGLLVWALTAFVGFVAISGAVSLMQRDGHPTALASTVAAPEPGTRADVARALEPINARLRQQGRIDLTVDEVIVAARKAADVDGYDRERFITALDEESALTRPEVEAVVRQMGNRAPAVIAAAHDLGEHRAAAIDTAEKVGCMFIVASLALLLGAVVAIGGALLAVRELVRRRGYDRDPVPRVRHDTEPGITHTTAPYPIPPDNHNPPQG